MNNKPKLFNADAITRKEQDRSLQDISVQSEHSIGDRLGRSAITSVRYARNVVARFYRLLRGDPRCHACGFRAMRIEGSALWPGLIAEWNLTPEWARWIDQREGHRCRQCGANLRSDILAKAIIDAVRSLIGARASSLKALFERSDVQRLRIAEINSAGSLHQFLSKGNNICYSEYDSNKTKVSDIPSEDLAALSYHDSTFDLVVTSETLEHVPDIDVALTEIYRVLKPNGLHVFTVPIVWSKSETRQRACIKQGQLVHMLPPSFHGSAENRDFLVFYEFGSDFVERLAGLGFAVKMVNDKANPATNAFITQKRRSAPPES
jgi:SAM-dependent methyltransferase